MPDPAQEMLVAPRRDVDGAAGVPARQTGETPVPPPEGE